MSISRTFGIPLLTSGGRISVPEAGIVEDQPMKRSIAFRPSLTDRLENRLVLSHVNPAIVAQAKTTPKAHAANLTTPLNVQGVIQETTSDGQVKTISTSFTQTSLFRGTSTRTTTYPNGTKQVETAMVASAGFLKSLSTGTVVLPDGSTQSTSETTTVGAAFGTIRPDGTVAKGKGGAVITSKFTRSIFQIGPGTETIQGTSVEGLVHKKLVLITNEQITNFDGSHETVRITRTATNDPSIVTVTTTTTQANGASVTTTATDKILSGSIS